MRRANTVQDFWKAVDKSGDCWSWTGWCNPDGYGEFKMSYRTYLAHRLSYELANGEIAPGLCVCHSCDNPACVNPSHLFLGTQADNVRDRVSKGHCARVVGEDNPHSKLTADDVLAIRRLFASGKSKRSTAKGFDISHRQVTRIVNREQWGWLAAE